MKAVGLLCTLAAVLCARAASGAAPGMGTIGGHVLVSPLRVGIEVPDRTPKAGSIFTIRADVTNDSGRALVGVAVRLVVPPALVLFDPAMQTVPRIGPGATRSTRWQLCSTAAGNYVALARATLGAFVAESTSAVVTVREAKRPSC